MGRLAFARGDRATPSRRRLEAAAAALLYASLSIGFFGLGVLRDFRGRYVGRAFEGIAPRFSEPSQYIWWMAWWPYAVSHHLNAFLPKVIWAPIGFNLAWTTGIPGPSLILWPFTYLFGPVASYNFSMLLSPALAAWAAFILCRYITKSFWSSLVGGYIFGFSTYMLGHMLCHVDL